MVRLNKKLYERNAVDSACKDFGAKAIDKGGYLEVNLEGKDAGEFSNYVLALMKAKC